LVYELDFLCYFCRSQRKISKMKFLTYLTVLAFSASILFSACKNDGDAAREAAVESLTPGQPAAGDAAAVTPPTTTPEPPQNAAGVWHYTCPKGCAGGGGSAVACATCGTTLAHNAAYHPPTPAPGAAPATNVTTLPEGITQVPNPTQTQTPEPAQNAAGVWHYTCASGCAGGGGSAVACAKCGKTLAHNQAYHK